MSSNSLVKVTTTFYAGYGLSTFVSTYVMLDVVKAGENASFNVILANATKSSQITDYSIAPDVNNAVSGNVPYRLNYSGISYIKDSSGNLHVTGQVTNNITSPAQKAYFCQVLATFYRQDWKVVYANWTYTNNVNLTSGSTDSFDIMALNSTISTPDKIITHTRLLVQCTQYSTATVTDFAVRIVGPQARSIAQGFSATYDIRVIPNPVINYSVNSATITAAGLPQGATATFSPSSTVFFGTGVGKQVILNITTSSGIGVGIGDFLITITGSGGGLAHAIPVVLTVNAASDFELTISPPSSSVSQGNQATYTVTARSGGGFSSSVTLNYSNIPTGSTANFSSSTIIPTPTGATTTFRIYTSLSTVLGSKTFTVCGQGGSKSHCASAQVIVTSSTAPSFSLSMSPPERTIFPGNFTTFTVTVTSINSFNQEVQLAVTGNPAGTTATLNPAKVTPPANDDIQSTLNISATSTPLFGTYTLTVTGSRTGFTTQTANATLIVSSFVEPDFAVYVLPTTLSVIQNNSGTATIQVVSINNFDGAVDLTLQNLPTGVTFSIANPTVAPFPGGYVNTKLTVQTSSSTTLGDHTMTLRGTSGGKTHSVTLGLLVTNQTLPLPFQCIIATATYGSEFTPEVQFLRGFRDNRVLATTSGSEFMKVFNAWYYSFSPRVAGWLAATPLARDITKLVLAPLLGILHLSEIFYTTFTFAPEIAVTFAGIVASSLIGMVYLGPILAIALRKRTGHFWSRILTPVALIWIFSVLLLTAGLVISVSLVVMAATSLLVLSTLTFGSCSLPIMISKLRPIIRKHV